MSVETQYPTGILITPSPLPRSLTGWSLVGVMSQLVRLGISFEYKVVERIGQREGSGGRTP